MVGMSPTITLKGHVEFSTIKVLSGSKLTMSEYIGPGEVLFAGSSLGDIMAIPQTGKVKVNSKGKEKGEWNIGRDAFLGHTGQVKHKLKTQKLSKAAFSGEGLWVYNITGTGMLWIQSFGAIVRKDVSSMS